MSFSLNIFDAFTNFYLSNLSFWASVLRSHYQSNYQNFRALFPKCQNKLRITKNDQGLFTVGDTFRFQELQQCGLLPAIVQS